MKRGARYWLNLTIFAAVTLALIPFLVLTGISYLYIGFFTRTPCTRPSHTPADIGITHFEDVTFQTPDGVTAHGLARLALVVRSDRRRSPFRRARVWW